MNRDIGDVYGSKTWPEGTKEMQELLLAYMCVPLNLKTYDARWALLPNNEAYPPRKCAPTA